MAEGASTSQFRADLQRRLTRFSHDAIRSRTTSGDPVCAVGSTTGPNRPDNQDRAATAVIRFPYDRNPRLQLAIICDGMGGLAGGAMAASEAISAFIAVVALTEGPLESVLDRAVLAANTAVHHRFKGEGGTTLTAVVSNNREAWYAHVGDSRLYDHGPEGLRLLTQDDTISGAIQAHEGGHDEDTLDNRLLQFVGIGDTIAPHIQRVHRTEGHMWLLTSDGAHGLGRKVLETLLEGGRNADDVVRRMVYVADALNVRDNASIAAVKQLDTFDRDTAISGTTIQITVPGGSLEIWLSERPEGDEKRERRHQDAPAVIKEDLPAPQSEASSASGESTGKAKRKGKGSRARQKSVAPRPLEVLFERKKADDSHS